MTKKYEIIYADPPWQYGGNMLSGSHIKQHYPTMKDEDLIKLDIKNRIGLAMFAIRHGIIAL